MAKYRNRIHILGGGGGQRRMVSVLGVLASTMTVCILLMYNNSLKSVTLTRQINNAVENKGNIFSSYEERLSELFVPRIRSVPKFNFSQRLRPGYAPNVGHIVWCGDEKRAYEFHHYISALSMIKALQPDMIFFHYEQSLPKVERQRYNTWFDELIERYPFIKTVKVELSSACDSHNKPKTSYIYETLNKSGGIYLHETTVLSGFSMELRDKTSMNGLQVDGTGFMLTNIGYLNENKAGQSADQFKCHIASLEGNQNYTFEIDPSTLGCIVTPTMYYPKDIMIRQDSVGRLGRRLFYNTEEVMIPKPSYDTLIPNIAHLAWVKGGNMDFLFYLCCLSLIYVQEVEMVYIYGDRPPSGVYWDKIKDHPKVSHIYRPSEVVVFNSTDVKLLGHVSDIWRIDLILKYGGIYTDTDVIFSRKLEPHYMGYDAIGSFDWPRHNAPFPDVVSLAPTMGKPGATFYQLARQTWREYSTMHNWNGLRQPYKVWERHPDLLKIDPHFQVICYRLQCHPTWVEDYHNYYRNHKNFPEFLENWREDTHAWHWTVANPPEYFSEQVLLTSTGLFADIGHLVMEKAGLFQNGKIVEAPWIKKNI